jgi:hypothetical protein
LQLSRTKGYLRAGAVGTESDGSDITIESISARYSLGRSSFDQWPRFNYLLPNLVPSIIDLQLLFNGRKGMYSSILDHRSTNQRLVPPLHHDGQQVRRARAWPTAPCSGFANLHTNDPNFNRTGLHSAWGNANV